jgi:hypothetical protein
MKSDNSANRLEIQPGAPTLRRRVLRRGVPVAMALACASALAAMSVPRDVAAQDDRSGPRCGVHTLRGDYGLIGSGIRGVGPGITETFTTVSMVTYDGQGAFTAVGVSHGQTTGVRAGLPVSGTYQVNADCTGAQTTHIPGAPPLEDSFVIVDNGKEVRTVVTSPATTIATANLRRK